MRVYFSHPIRGKKGKDATIQDMEANNKKAVRIAKEWKCMLDDVLCESGPVEFYVPGEHDEFVMLAYNHGYLDETQILDIDCVIIDRCDLVLVYNEEQISHGMQVEIDYARGHGMPVLFTKGTPNE